MSNARREIVRGIVERWNARDHGFEAFQDYFDPTFEMESPLASVRGAPCRGYAGIEPWAGDLDEQFVEWAIGPEDPRSIGGQVLIMGTIDARGRASGITMRLSTASVWDFGADDGVTHIRIYSDRNEALKAVGLEQWPVSKSLDVVRSIYESWERGDFSSTEWAHREIEFVSARELYPGSWTGLAGMREGERRLLDAFEAFSTSAEEFRELDGERVLVFTHRSGRGKRTGLELEQLGPEGADLVHVRDGKVTKFVIYGDRKHAFADLGLLPGGGPPDS